MPGVILILTTGGGIKGRLRFLCFASLFAVILLTGFANQGGFSADLESSKPPTPGDQRGIDPPANLRESSGTILITMTGIVGDPGDIGQGK